MILQKGYGTKNTRHMQKERSIYDTDP